MTHKFITLLLRNACYIIRDLDKVHARGQLGLNLVKGSTAILTWAKVEASTEGNQMGVVGGWDHRDGASAAGKGVAELVAEELQFVGLELVVVIDNMVMGGTGSSLETSVGAEEEIKLAGMTDGGVDDSSGGNVTAAISILSVGNKETSVMALLDEDKGDGGSISGINLTTGSLDGGQFKLEDLGKLTLRHTITVEEDTMGENLAGIAETEEMLLGHRL